MQFPGVGIGGSSDDDQMSGSGELGHCGAEQADWARPDDRNGVAGAQTGVDASGVVGNGARLGQGRLLKTERIWNVMKAARWNPYKGRHCSVDSVTEPEPMRVEVVETLAGMRANRAGALRPFHSPRDHPL